MAVRSVVVAGLIAATLGGVALAASKTFPAPSGWDAIQQSTPPGSQTTYQGWKLHSGDLMQTVTVIDDPSQPYADVVARIHKNLVENKFKVNADKDQPCNGETGHLFSMVYGPDIKRIAVYRLLVPDGPGSIQITYMRPEPEPAAGEVKAGVNSYCGTTVM